MQDLPLPRVNLLAFLLWALSVRTTGPNSC
jgi:hypothetical protein